MISFDFRPFNNSSEFIAAGVSRYGSAEAFADAIALDFVSFFEALNAWLGNKSANIDPWTGFPDVTEQGTLTVTIENDGSPGWPDASFGGWSIDGGTTYNDSGDSLTLDAGTYTITYKEISYRLSPADESVTIYAGGSYSTTGTYVTCGALYVRTNYYYGTSTYIGQWSVNGGTDWHKPYVSLKLAAGWYTVTFKAVDGYTTPLDQSVGVFDGNTYFSSNNDYVAKSNLTVTTDPTRGEWSINGGDRWEDSGDKIYIVPDTYTLTFKAIYGYTTPADQTITLADGDSSTATGTYTAKGTLTVTTDPTSGYWGTDPYETWNMSGDSMTLDAGTYTVYFGDITGYTAPSSQSVTITDGNDTAITGTYTAD